MKYSGSIGFVEEKETSPGVWVEDAIEKPYKGDIISNRRRWDNNQQVNETLVINNTISIVYDQFLVNHVHAVRYVNWIGSKWKVTNVDFQPPRMILTIGGVYNG